MMECIGSKMHRSLYPSSLSLYIPTASIRVVDSVKHNYRSPTGERHGLSASNKFSSGSVQHIYYANQVDLDALVEGLQQAIESGDRDGRQYLTERRKLFELRSQVCHVARV